VAIVWGNAGVESGGQLVRRVIGAPDCGILVGPSGVPKRCLLTAIHELTLIPMARLFHPLLHLIARAAEHELAQMIDYLKTENRVQRARLPKKIETTPAERAQLIKAGKPLGPKIKELISIVTPGTFARWVRADEDPKRKPSAKRGRPRTPAEVEQLVLSMARESGWGYGRIVGELKKLKVGHLVSRSTVRRILKESGFDTGPKRGLGSWGDYIKAHAKTLWACDFFTKTVWTAKGRVEFYVLFVIHVATRRVHIVNVTPNPDGVWMAQQARNMAIELFDPDAPVTLICDNDGKFTPQFKSILKCSGVTVKHIPPHSPNLNPFAERWVQSVKRECLNHFTVFGETHLRYLLREYLSYYHQFRPHQGLGNTAPFPAEPPADEGEVVCKELLGGVLRHYHRQAA
jgi:putative transposase